jgi:hypothetical protein
MTVPDIHLNGTSKESLIEDLCTASAAIEAAYQAVKQTAPNGRDYYRVGIKELESAERLKKLDEVKHELDTLTMAIDAK